MDWHGFYRASRVLGRIGSAACLACITVAAGGAERTWVRSSPAQIAAEAGSARVIVKFRSDKPDAARAAAGTTALPLQRAQALRASTGIALRDGRTLGARSQIVLADGIGSRALAARLAAHPDVEYAVVDGRQRALAAPSDPLYGAGQSVNSLAAGQWYLRAPDATTPAAIHAEAAWEVTTGKGGIVVAVLDTGVRPEHPDLQGKLLPGYDFIREIAKAGDADGRDADASDPGDFVTAADVGSVTGCSTGDIGPSSWHGTQVAGLIGAATDNGTGIASIGRDVMLLPVRVLGKCGGYDSDIQSAMRWAAGLSVPGAPLNPHPARVINLSLGSPDTCSAAFQDVIDELRTVGAVVVAAAGNDGGAVGTPASCAGVVAVAGLRHLGTKAGFSNFGPEITLGAPAGNCTSGTGPCQYALLTTTNSGTAGPAESLYTDALNHVSVGTSFSAPLVAGTVALMLTANRELTPGQVIDALRASARPYPTGGAAAGVASCKASGSGLQNSECYCVAATCGAGMLDAGAAVHAVATLSASVAAPAAPTAGTPIVLDGSRSVARTSAIVGYRWAITADSAGTSFSSATNASTATLVATRAGSATIVLTVTDATDHQDTATTQLTIASASAPIVATSAGAGTSVAAAAAEPAGGGSGGGGAFDPIDLAAMLVAVLAMIAIRPRRVRAPA